MKYKFPTALKAVLFDMDGVLYDSMPYHARAWKQVFKEHGLDIPDDFPYLHEGRTGDGFVQLIFQEQFNRKATPQEVEAIYARKSELFNAFPKAEKMKGIDRVIAHIKKDNLLRTIVTGSGQRSLIEKVAKQFPETFCPSLLVTAFDVKNGKPHPEPYLKGLEKLQVKAHEAIVIENAPMGVKAGVAAGIFTIAVNTGILNDDVLWNAGADMVFRSMDELADQWDELRK